MGFINLLAHVANMTFQHINEIVSCEIVQVYVSNKFGKSYG
jgi:hypothetical protein